ncbi:MAG: DUF4396 domain-containing protein [Rhodobacteraceae bacterium]|nr:DUF4396 domain-containing protein [Paracoccaceae bacterium]
MEHHDHPSAKSSGGTLRPALLATLHCATGCVIGEVLGLAIGITIGAGAWISMGIGTVLAFVFGLSLAVVPLARSQGVSLGKAFRMIWLGEVASIAAMELVMNATDYLLGGANAQSLTAPVFWWSLLAAIPLGYLAALPVNYVMIARGGGHHHHG